MVQFLADFGKSKGASFQCILPICRPCHGLQYPPRVFLLTSGVRAHDWAESDGVCHCAWGFDNFLGHYSLRSPVTIGCWDVLGQSTWMYVVFFGTEDSQHVLNEGLDPEDAIVELQAEQKLQS